MSQYLPNKNEIDKFCLNLIGGKNSYGYILEVDLEFLDELHELCNDYALTPEKREISQKLLQIGVNKLIPNLGKKSKYVLYYRTRHLYMLLEVRTHD